MLVHSVKWRSISLVTVRKKVFILPMSYYDMEGPGPLEGIVLIV